MRFFEEHLPVTRADLWGVVPSVKGATVVTVPEQGPAVAGTGDGADGVEALFRARARSLLGMITVFTGDRRGAEDVVQEAFARLQRAWPTLRDSGRADAYLRATAFNLARSQGRRRSVVERLRWRRPEDESSAEEGAVLRDDQKAVIDAVSRLPGRQKECVLLRFYGELTEVAIAETLGISQSSVKVHLRRGMAALAETLEGRA
jgi:RNA polymerase sigma-70 factor (sigma-E family)